ncbi:MAG: hypothetical protein ABL309_11895 [Phycisphaerales bacterium]
MSKTRNRNKSRQRPRRSSTAASHAPQEPAAPPGPAPDAHQLDLLLRLWENSEFALADIADALNLPMPAFMALLKRPEVVELLQQLGDLLELRLRHTAARIAPRAIETLEAVQTEAEKASASTPVSPEAIQADRRAATSRNQRRLAATAALAHHRALRTPPKPLRFPKQEPTDEPADQKRDPAPQSEPAPAAAA